jgi:hypothetical protein
MEKSSWTLKDENALLDHKRDLNKTRVYDKENYGLVKNVSEVFGITYGRQKEYRLFVMYTTKEYN